jgi:hypothetical protein
VRIILAAIILPALLAVAAAAQPSQRLYAKGQVWKYHTRPQDPLSLIKIGEMEDGAGAGPVYHISVIGVHFQGIETTGTIGHLPVSRASLDKSVTELTKSNAAFPDVANGIAQWRAAHGGVFSLSIAEIVNFVDQTVQTHRPAANQ